MDIKKKISVVDIMMGIQDKARLLTDPHRSPVNPFEESLTWYGGEAERYREVRLIAGERFFLFKRIILRVLRLCTRTLELFNYNINKYVLNLNAKLNFLFNRLQIEQNSHNQAVDLDLDSIKKNLIQTDLLERVTILERQMRREDLQRPESKEIQSNRPEQKFNFFLFEQHFRKDSESISASFADYLPYFEGCSRILDLGCGRGEFLELFKNAAKVVVGIDRDPSMVALCQEKGLNVQQGDFFSYLHNANEKWDGIFASQVVEHLEFNRVIEFIRICYEHLEKGGIFIAETPNPQCLLIYTGSFIMDPTHRCVLHPATFSHLLIDNGFPGPEIIYKTPVNGRLSLLENPKTEFELEYNQAIHRLNEVLFSHLDYAIIARKPE